MSFSMTTEAARRREKTVTRRLGWWFLRPGDIVQQVEKAQGLRKGEHVVKLHVIRILSTKMELLCSMSMHDPGECAREGFPELSTEEFIAMFCEANRVYRDVMVNRIEFEYECPDEEGREHVLLSC